MTAMPVQHAFNGNSTNGNTVRQGCPAASRRPWQRTWNSMACNIRRSVWCLFCLGAFLASVAHTVAGEDAGGGETSPLLEEYADAERAHWSFEPLGDVAAPCFDAAEDRVWVQIGRASCRERV